MSRKFRLLGLSSAIVASFAITLFGASPGQAADLVEQTVAGFRFPDRLPPRGRALPDCTETRPDHLLGCIPRELVLILPDEPVANTVYTQRPARPRRPYPQVFVWGP